MTNSERKTLDGISTYELTQYLQRDRKTAFIMWQAEDVKIAAESVGVELTDNQIVDVLFELNDNADAGIGISWFEVEEMTERIAKR